MKTPIRRMFINELPNGPYRLVSPVEIHIFREPKGGFRATAPELGMWVDGLGKTEADATEDLCDAIIVQRESIGDRSESQFSEYARAIKKAFERQLLAV